MQLSQKQQKFSEFFAAFLKSRSNFENIKKKEKNTLMVNVFSKLRTSKNLVT